MAPLSVLMSSQSCSMRRANGRLSGPLAAATLPSFCTQFLPEKVDQRMGALQVPSQLRGDLAPIWVT